MISLFRYNWQVRDEWFEWCEQVSNEELLSKRTGGVGSILQTLYHIVVTELVWTRRLQGESYSPESFDKYQSLEQVKQLSSECHLEVKAFLDTWTDAQENKMAYVAKFNQEFSHGGVLRHMISHEIHHSGQLSVWSRELGLAPVASGFLGRNLSDQK